MARLFQVSEIFGFGACFFFIVVAVVAPFWTPGSPYAMDFGNVSAPPSLAHGLVNLLGTDLYGRSILPRLMIAISNSFQVVLAGLVTGFPLGSALGLWFGSKGSNSLVSEFFDFLTGVPTVVFAVLLAAFAGGGKESLMLVVALSMCTIFFRIAYIGSKRIRAMPFVSLSFMMGKSRFFVVRKHIFPNLKHNLLCQLCPQVITCLMIESGINYLGLGLPLEIPSLGGLIYEGHLFFFYSWEAVAGLLTLLLLSLSLGIVYLHFSKTWGIYE